MNRIEKITDTLNAAALLAFIVTLPLWLLLLPMSIPMFMKFRDVLNGKPAFGAQELVALFFVVALFIYGASC